MKLTWLAVPLAVSSAKFIPISSPHGGPHLHGHDLSSGAFGLEGRAQKEMSFAQAKQLAAKEFRAKTVDVNFRLKWDLKTECTKCKGKQVTDKKKDGKCRDCKKGTKPNDDHTKCMRDDTGCAEDEISKGDKKCEKCDKDMVAGDDGKSCTKSNGSGKEKGKCAEGKVLDPAEGGQDADTKDPKCIDDDDKKCPDGQKSATRKSGSKDEADYEPECAADDDSDHKCDDKNTYDHKEIEDDKIKHSCRSTRKSQDDKKNKYTDIADRAKTEKSDNDKKNTKKRGRSGWCLVALAGVEATAFTAADLEDMSQDEVDGMVGIWPDEKIPEPEGDGSIPDHVVRWEPVLVVQPGQGDTAGLGGIFSSIGKAIGKIFGKGGGAAANTEVRSVLKELKTGKRPDPSKNAVKTAEGSGKVKKMLKSADFLDCLGSTAATSGSGKSRRDDDDDADLWRVQTGKGIIDVDWTREPDEKIKPLPEDTDDQVISLKYSDKTDESYSALPLQTFHDSYHRSNRLYYESCMQPMRVGYQDNLDNKITDVDTKGGCCAFYDGDDCQGDTLLFAMTNRQDGQLRGKHNDAISSFWCTFDEGCAGAPGN